MRYSDAKQLKAQKVARRRELNQSIEDEVMKTYREEEAATCFRTWSLGLLRAARWDRPGELLITFAGFDGGEDPIPQLMISCSVHEHNARSIIYWDAEQIEQLAEIRRLFDRWMKGEIDELPPSGVWTAVRP